METPFIFGKLASGEDFTNRKGEVDKLRNNFISGINTIIISPRRWGKSSLVARAAKLSADKNKKVKFVFIDLFNVRDEEEFYELLTREVLKASGGKWKEMVDNAKKFLGRFIPRITLGAEEASEISVGLDWQEVKKFPDEILNLPEKIAKEKGIRFIICIDEFQNITEFKEPEYIQKKLRANWQKHKHTSYCLYGSKRHMMMEVFSSASMPFYKFGELIFLEKIKQEEWIKYLQKRFSDTGKKIEKKEAGAIADLVENHPYYVQQLAQQVWFRTKDIATDAIVKTSFEQLTLQLSLLFQRLTDDLTAPQVNFLKAVLDGVEQLSSKETLKEYRLGTSANVLRIKDALVKKEIIDLYGPKLEFLDPLYKNWLKRFYFI